MKHLPIDHEKQPACIPISWEDVTEMTSILTQHVLAHGRPEIIVALQRGGLIPGVCLAHQFCDNMISLPVRRTTSDAIYASKHLPVIDPEYVPLLSAIAGKDVLVVDDIAGSGDTLSAVTRLLITLNPSHIRSLVYFVNLANWKRQACPETSITYIGRRVQGWVIFPWEASIPGASSREQTTPNKGIIPQ